MCTSIPWTEVIYLFKRFRCSPPTFRVAKKWVQAVVNCSSSLASSPSHRLRPAMAVCSLKRSFPSIRSIYFKGNSIFNPFIIIFYIQSSMYRSQKFGLPRRSFYQNLFPWSLLISALIYSTYINVFASISISGGRLILCDPLDHKKRRSFVQPERQYLFIADYYIQRKYVQIGHWTCCMRYKEYAHCTQVNKIFIFKMNYSITNKLRWIDILL